MSIFETLNATSARFGVLRKLHLSHHIPSLRVANAVAFHSTVFVPETELVVCKSECVCCLELIAVGDGNQKTIKCASVQSFEFFDCVVLILIHRRAAVGNPLDGSRLASPEKSTGRCTWTGQPALCASSGERKPRCASIKYTGPLRSRRTTSRCAHTRFWADGAIYLRGTSRCRIHAPQTRGLTRRIGTPVGRTPHSSARGGWCCGTAGTVSPSCRLLMRACGRMTCK